MALYFKETEITNIDNLVPQSGLDITDMWFGTTRVYTVWAVYEGTLPATLNANGDDMRQYQIYGATGGVGDRTASIFNFSENAQGDGYISNSILRDDGISAATAFFVSAYLPISQEQSYVYYTNVFRSTRGVIEFYKYDNGNYEFISRVSQQAVPPGLSEYDPTKAAVVTAPSEATHMRINVDKWASQFYIVEGTTPPENYVPYGYGVDISTEKPIIYGFHINPNDPNSYTAVTYLEDAVGKTPAAMGSTAFSYGDWANAFFMPRPCMLKYDGTVDYYLNPNDYSQKADGTASDYNDLAYGGNAMMEFPLIWYKFVQGTESGEGYFYCSNRKVDDGYKCFSNLDCDGNIIEHFYMPIYNGCTYDGKMRSISGLQLSPWSTTAYSTSSTYAIGSKVNYNGRMWKCTTAVEAAEAFDPAKWEQFAFNGNTTGTEEITQAAANNTTAKVEWYTNVLCDRQLINALLVLLGKSLDTQGSFGRGIDAGDYPTKEAYVTGSLNSKGLFYGSTANGNTAVKVFGMENWWGCSLRRTAGLIGAADNIYKYKMTYSTADGSTANGYNTNGTGYLSIGNKPVTDNYIKKMQYGLFGFLPIEVGSYSTQYWKDFYYNGTGYALFGGSTAFAAYVGAFFANLRRDAGFRNWAFSSNLSCKPCRVGNLSKNFEAATVTPIYIGNEPLGKDEYVDYQAGKIYRVNPNNLFDGSLLNGYYTNADFDLSSASDSLRIYKSFKLFLPAGTYSLCFYKPTFIARRIINGVMDTTHPVIAHIVFTCESDSYVGFSYKLYNYIQGDNPDINFVVIAGAKYEFLSPTDPPVALPALPTCEGTTIVDYAGESQATPEKVLLKYRKENF